MTAKQNGHAFDVEAAGERHGDTVDGLTMHRLCTGYAMVNSFPEQTSHKAKPHAGLIMVNAGVLRF